MIIRSSRELREHYDELKPGDCFIGMLGFRNIKYRVFVDLLERGIRILPSAISQTLSSSKAAQSHVLRQWMIPNTLTITGRADLMRTINIYNEHNIGPVVTKEDRFDCGFGIHKWDDIEAVYNHASLNANTYPFVVQPLISNYTDIRAIVAGDYCEAYTRENQYNFRMNLTAGGRSRSYKLNKDQLALCHNVMKRGRFPYAHIDILVTDNGRNYVSEISLKGGMKGAIIDRKKLDAIKMGILEKMGGQEL